MTRSLKSSRGTSGIITKETDLLLEFIFTTLGYVTLFSLQSSDDFLSQLTSQSKLQLLKNFFSYAATFQDVFFVTPSQIIAWVKSPRTAQQTRSMPEMQCPPLPTSPS